MEEHPAEQELFGKGVEELAVLHPASTLPEGGCLPQAIPLP
jgi:hypothetical protein